MQLNIDKIESIAKNLQEAANSKDFTTAANCINSNSL